MHEVTLFFPFPFMILSITCWENNIRPYQITWGLIPLLSGLSALCIFHGFVLTAVFSKRTLDR